jgi:hypothetical protein
MTRTGKPYSDASRPNALSAASSFYTHWDKVSDNGVKNPFDAVQRRLSTRLLAPGYTEAECDAGKKTSDAKTSCEGETGFWRGREGYVFVEGDAVSQAVVQAADHPVEEVPLGGCVSISGFASAVVVSPRSV